MDVTKPYEFIGFGARDVTKPYEFIGFGAMDFVHTGLVSLPGQLPPALRSAGRETTRRGPSSIPIYHVHTSSSQQGPIPPLVLAACFLSTLDIGVFAVLGPGCYQTL